MDDIIDTFGWVLAGTAVIGTERWSIRGAKRRRFARVSDCDEVNLKKNVCT